MFFVSLCGTLYIVLCLVLGVGYTVGVNKEFAFALRTTAVLRMPVLTSTEKLRTNYGSTRSVGMVCACACHTHFLRGANRHLPMPRVNSWDSHGTTLSSEGTAANATNTSFFSDLWEGDGLHGSVCRWAKSTCST